MGQNKQDTFPPQSFSYARLIVETKLAGLPAMIACQCEPVFYNASIPFLRMEMPESLQPLKDTPAMEQFKDALKQYFGPSVELEFIPGPASKSPAAVASSKKLSALIKAHEEMMKDDLVNDMIKNFGGKVLIESIEPVVSTAPKKAP